jgi:addiction module HigA family antidote
LNRFRRGGLNHDPPGEEHLVPLGLSVNALAGALQVPATRMNDIVRERRVETADTALRLALYFGTTERYWLNLQTEYELRLAQIQSADRVRREVEPRAA